MKRAIEEALPNYKPNDETSLVPQTHLPNKLQGHPLNSCLTSSNDILLNKNKSIDIPLANPWQGGSPIGSKLYLTPKYYRKSPADIPNSHLLEYGGSTSRGLEKQVLLKDNNIAGGSSSQTNKGDFEFFGDSNKAILTPHGIYPCISTDLPNAESKYLSEAKIYKLPTSAYKDVPFPDWNDKCIYYNQESRNLNNNHIYRTTLRSTSPKNPSNKINPHALSDLKDDDVWLPMSTIINRRGQQSTSNSMLRSYDDPYFTNYNHDTSNTNNNGISVYNISQSKQRKRTQFTQEQLNNLEELFQENHYPNSEEKKRLSYRINIEEAKIHVWFQNRRSRENKMRRFNNKRLKTVGSLKLAPSIVTDNEAIAVLTSPEVNSMYKGTKMEMKREFKSNVSAMSAFSTILPPLKTKLETAIIPMPSTFNNYTQTTDKDLLNESLLSKFLWQMPQVDNLDRQRSFVISNKTTGSIDVRKPTTNCEIKQGNISSPSSPLTQQPPSITTKFDIGLNDVTNNLLFNNFTYANYMINGCANQADGGAVNEPKLNNLSCYNGEKIELLSVAIPGHSNIEASPKVVNSNIMPRLCPDSLGPFLYTNYYPKTMPRFTNDMPICDDDSGISNPSTRGSLISPSTLSPNNIFHTSSIILKDNMATLPDTTEDDEHLFGINILSDDILNSSFGGIACEGATSSNLNHNTNLQKGPRSRLGSLSFLDDIFLYEDYSKYDADVSFKVDNSNTNVECSAVRDFLDEVNPLFANDPLRGYHSEDFDAEF